MFRIHETTRRRVCRTAFLLLCVAPTLATAMWILHAHRPWRLADEQSRLGAPWRLNVQLADWREPRPGAARSTGLTVVDPVSARVLAEATNLDLRSGDGGESIGIQSITLDLAQWHVLADRAHDWLLDCDESIIQLHAGSLVLTSPNASERCEFRDVQLRIERAASTGLRAQLIARTVGDVEPATIRLTLERPTGNSAGSLRASVDAATAELPTWLVATFVPVLGDFGSDATFNGSIQWEIAANQAGGAAQGRLRNVAIGSLLAAHAPYAVQGRAHVQLAELVWRGREIERLVGSAEGENLSLSRSLVAAAVKHLLCVQTSAGRAISEVGGSASDDARTLVAIDRLAARFALTRNGLTLTGELGDHPGLPPGCLATSGGQAFLMQPPCIELPAGQWVQFIAGPSVSWVPATQEAIDVAARLPLPSAGAEILK
jgi:hypothetical protein